VLAFLLSVVKSAYLRFIAPGFITINSLVLVWVVKSLNCGMALVAEEASGAKFPAELGIAGAHRFAIFGHIFENFGRSPEVSHVVRIYATLGVVRLLAVGAPA
jgi:hypothetical protein